ncbi:CNH domain-containing protein [Meloidogyne graminicola]|uniref:CNH domain-containing protein n=1 Tax=Meloidogyne graminicola TaxID=189291 RepID=A0A8S9ZN56_9BILA|nr:CNH domain-containing protein [Meloidogyne graminicola]
MFNAYTLEEVVSKLPLEANSISNYTGHNNSSYDYQVCRSFEKRPIINLSVIESLDRIICLTDTHLSIHEAYTPYRCQSNSLFISTKSEHFFAKLLINQLNSKESINRISIIEVPRLISSISSHSSHFESSYPIAPCLLPDKNLVALNKNDKTLQYVDMDNGRQIKLSDDGESYCQFSDSIIDFVYDSPYILAILSSNCIEIRLLSSSALIQKLTLNKFSMLTVGKRGSIYAANDTQAWRLDTNDKLRDNLKYLTNINQYEIALQIANVYCDVIEINEIINLKKEIAIKSFLDKKFSKCFDIHAELKTDILFVINLFPKLLPEKYSCSTIKYNDELKLYGILKDENDLENEGIYKNAVDALIKYISMKRQEHSKPINLHFLDYKEERKENLLSTNSLKRHEIALELIDTVLLKAYLLINPKLIGPLLRLKNCCCIISEAEKDLKRAEMFDELLILYERKKLFRKCFIFTCVDSLDAKNFDRDSVLQFLKRQFPSAVIPYLEHIIYEWEDKRPKFHEELVHQYIIRIKLLLSQFVKALPINNQFMRSLSSNNDDGIDNELVILRKKLRSFLETDKYYTVKDVLKLIETDEVLADEQAILYGRLGQHKEALSIYTNKLVDFAAAERHCLLYYDEKDFNNSQIFYNLFCFYLSGIDNLKENKKYEENEEQLKELYSQKRPNITEALKLLRRHANKINIVKAFALIPSDTPLSRIDVALKAVFETICSRLTMLNLIMGLTQIAINRTEAHFKLLKQQRINIDERIVCFMCKKRIMERIMENDIINENTISLLGHPDGFVTQTSNEQIKLEEMIISIRSKVNLNHRFVLYRQQHINYILELLHNLPNSYSELSASRTWLCFWGVHSLRLLGGHLKNELANKIISFLNLCKSSGGYGGAPGLCPHIVTTYAAVMALVEIGTDEALTSIEVEKLRKFILSMKQPNGSFCVHKDGEIDVRAVYCAIAVSYLCNFLNLDELFEGTSSWLTLCQTYEGGFGGEPGCEAHGGYTFCALASLAFLQKMHLIDVQPLLRWLVFRQMKLEGGFQEPIHPLLNISKNAYEKAFDYFNKLKC